MATNAVIPGENAPLIPPAPPVIPAIIAPVAIAYIFVSHSDPIRAIASYYMGLSEGESFGMAIKNGSMTVIARSPLKLLSLGAINLDDKIKSIFS